MEIDAAEGSLGPQRSATCDDVRNVQLGPVVEETADYQGNPGSSTIQTTAQEEEKPAMLAPLDGLQLRPQPMDAAANEEAHDPTISPRPGESRVSTHSEKDSASPRQATGGASPPAAYTTPSPIGFQALNLPEDDRLPPMPTTDDAAEDKSAGAPLQSPSSDSNMAEPPSSRADPGHSRNSPIVLKEEPHSPNLFFEPAATDDQNDARPPTDEHNHDAADAFIRSVFFTLSAKPPIYGASRKGARAALRELAELANECTQIRTDVDDAAELLTHCSQVLDTIGKRMRMMQDQRLTIERWYLKFIKQDPSLTDGTWHVPPEQRARVRREIRLNEEVDWPNEPEILPEMMDDGEEHGDSDTQVIESTDSNEDKNDDDDDDDDDDDAASEKGEGKW